MSVFIKSEYKLSDDSFNHALPCADYCLYENSEGILKIKDTLKIFNIVLLPILSIFPLIMSFKYIEEKVILYSTYVEYNDNPESLFFYMLNFFSSYIKRELYWSFLMYSVSVIVFIFMFYWCF